MLRRAWAARDLDGPVGDECSTDFETISAAVLRERWDRQPKALGWRLARIETGSSSCIICLDFEVLYAQHYLGLAGHRPIGLQRAA